MIWHRECDSDWQCLFLAESKATTKTHFIISHEAPRFHQRNRNRDRSYQLKESFSTNLLCWSPSEQSAWPPGPTPLGFVRFQLPQPRTVWLHCAGQSKVFVKTWEWCPALRFQQIPDVSMIPELYMSISELTICISILYIYNISLHVNSFQDMVQKSDEDCANQIYWWQKYTQQCKLHHIQKGIYCRPSTGEHMSGWGPQFLKVWCGHHFSM